MLVRDADSPMQLTVLPLQLASHGASLVLIPARVPAATSAWATHPRRVSELIPTCPPIRAHAPSREAGRFRASRGSRIARSRGSFGYFRGGAMRRPPWFHGLPPPGTRQAPVDGRWPVRNQRQRGTPFSSRLHAERQLHRQHRPRLKCGPPAATVPAPLVPGVEPQPPFDCRVTCSGCAGLRRRRRSGRRRATSGRSLP